MSTASTRTVLLALALAATADAGAADPRLAEARLAQGAYRLAAMEFRGVLEANPGESRAALGLARSLAGMGRCREALDAMDRVRGGPGWGPAALLAEGDCAARLGDRARAVAAWEEAVAQDPSHALSWHRLLLDALLAGDPVAAARAEDALWATPFGLVMTRLAEARVSVILGDPLADGRLFELRGFTAVPEVAAEWQRLEGWRWLQVGDPDAAAEAWLEAMKLDPQDPEAVAGRAEALRRAGRPQDALAVFDRGHVLLRDPTRAEQAVREAILADLEAGR